MSEAEWPTVGDTYTSPEGEVRVTGHYWNQHGVRIEICWTDRTTLYHRELVTLDEFHRRFPKEDSDAFTNQR